MVAVTARTPLDARIREIAAATRMAVISSDGSVKPSVQETLVVALCEAYELGAAAEHEALKSAHDALEKLSVSPSEYADNSDDASRCWCPAEWDSESLGHCPLCVMVAPLFAKVEAALAAALRDSGGAR